MKKLLFFIMAASLFAASCNDNKNKNGMNTNNRERDDYRNNDNRNNDNRNNNRDDNYYDDNNNSGGWTNSQKNQWLRMCVEPLKESVDETKAKNYCRCVLDKMIEMYPNPNDAGQGTEELGQQLGLQCASALLEQ